jgi:hypothetical protein
MAALVYKTGLSRSHLFLGVYKTGIKYAIRYAINRQEMEESTWKTKDRLKAA